MFCPDDRGALYHNSPTQSCPSRTTILLSQGKYICGLGLGLVLIYNVKPIQVSSRYADILNVIKNK